MSRHRFGMDSDMDVAIDPTKQNGPNLTVEPQALASLSLSPIDTLEPDEACPHEVILAL